MSLDNFIKTFELEQVQLEVSKYDFKDNMIVISEIKILDSGKKFIRFADLSKIQKYLKFSLDIKKTHIKISFELQIVLVFHFYVMELV